MSIVSCVLNLRLGFLYKTPAFPRGPAHFRPGSSFTLRHPRLAEALERQGIWPSFAPFGHFDAIGPEGKWTIAPNPALAPIIRCRFERYLTGRHSLKEIAKLVRQAGMQYRNLKFPVPTSSIHKVLRNRLYCGVFDFDGTA